MPKTDMAALQNIRTMLKDGNSREAKLIKHNVKLAERIRRILSDACRSLSLDRASAVAVDLADIGEIGVRHNRYLRQLLKMRFPKDLPKLEVLLVQWIDVQLLFHNQWHLNSLKRQLPNMLRCISRELNSESKGKTKRMRPAD